MVAWDADDATRARQMGHLLEWDVSDSDQREDLKKTLFATYTLRRRPAAK